MNNRNYSPQAVALTDMLMEQSLFPKFEDENFFRLTMVRGKLHLKSFSFFDKCPIDKLNKLNPPVVSYNPLFYMGNLRVYLDGKYGPHNFSKASEIISSFINGSKDKILFDVKKELAKIIMKEHKDSIPLYAMAFHYHLLLTAVTYPTTENVIEKKEPITPSDIALDADSFIEQIQYDCDYCGGGIVIKAANQLYDYCKQNAIGKEKKDLKQLTRIAECLIEKLPEEEQLLLDYGHGIKKLEKGYVVDRTKVAEYIVWYFQNNL